MGESKSREISVLRRELGKSIDDYGEFLEEESECFADEDKIGITLRIKSYELLSGGIKFRRKRTYSVT